METSLKKELLSYIEKHNDGSAEASRLIRKLNDALGYVDINTHSLCPDDLENGLSEEATAILRNKLSKEESEPFTIEDCEVVSEWMADTIADEFSEVLHNAIMY